MTQIKSIVKKMRTANLHTSEAMPATNLLDVRSIESIRGGGKSLITNNLEANEIKYRPACSVVLKHCTRAFCVSELLKCSEKGFFRNNASKLVKNVTTN